VPNEPRKLVLVEPIRVRFQISDPWDLGESLSWKPLVGDLIDVVQQNGREHGLLRSDAPFGPSGEERRHFITGPRHEGKGFADLLAGTKIPASCLAITDAQVTATWWTAEQAWRGRGLAMIGSLTRVAPGASDSAS